MANLTTDEAAWIKATTEALIAIRDATRSRPDEDQARDIRFLADAFHNIGMVEGENSMFAHLHTPDRLAEAQKITRRLFDSAHRPTPTKSSLLENMFRLKRP